VHIQSKVDDLKRVCYFKKNNKGKKMKVLAVFLGLCIGYLSPTYAEPEGFQLQYVKPFVIKIISKKAGVTTREYMRCTPYTCCFSERFYCFMSNGKCICDLHVCGQESSKKRFWMEISGTEAERVCGRPIPLHALTHLCRCDPERRSPCNPCTTPENNFTPGPMEGLSLPPDCRSFN
jgi:hypothetical protein